MAPLDPVARPARRRGNVGKSRGLHRRLSRVLARGRAVCEGRERCYDRPHVQEARCARWLGGWCAKGPRRPFIFRLLSLGGFLLISVRHINTCVRLLEKSSRNILLFPASPREPALALAPPSPPPAPAMAPSRRPRRSSPRLLPTHPYNLRPIPGRTRVPNTYTDISY